MTKTDHQLQRDSLPQNNPFPEQDENGVDLSLLKENLKLTPTERIRKGDKARRDALRLLEYGRRHRKKHA